MSYWTIILLANIVGFSLLFLVLLTRPRRRTKTTTIITTHATKDARLTDKSGD